MNDRTECLALVLLKSAGTNIGILALLGTYIGLNVLLQYQSETDANKLKVQYILLLYSRGGKREQII
jgi:hypothetical protein